MPPKAARRKRHFARFIRMPALLFYKTRAVRPPGKQAAFVPCLWFHPARHAFRPGPEPGFWNQSPGSTSKKIAMRYFLMKTDPSTYSAADLEREGRTVWDGVTNPQAVRFIREMKKGDRAFLYHSGGESAIVALAKIVSAPRPDPGNPKSWVVDIEFPRRIEPPVTLREIKQSGLFDGWALVRQGRLSTMDVPDAFLDWMRSRYPALKL